MKRFILKNIHHHSCFLSFYLLKYCNVSFLKTLTPPPSNIVPDNICWTQYKRQHHNVYSVSDKVRSKYRTLEDRWPTTDHPSSSSVRKYFIETFECQNKDSPSCFFFFLSKLQLSFLITCRLFHVEKGRLEIMPREQWGLPDR